MLKDSADFLKSSVMSELQGSCLKKSRIFWAPLNSRRRIVVVRFGTFLVAYNYDSGFWGPPSSKVRLISLWVLWFSSPILVTICSLSMDFSYNQATRWRMAPVPVRVWLISLRVR